ncbi:hypothetical protein TNCV_4733621 [Trichonephila clavipes]|nr:hypothetical protein TNCV_4733621 [Trichonephila clavipes]
MVNDVDDTRAGILKREDVSALDRFNVHLPYTAGYWDRTRDQALPRPPASPGKAVLRENNSTQQQERTTQLGSRNETTQLGSRNETTQLGSRNETTQLVSRNETTQLVSRNETTQLVSRNETSQLCTAVNRLQPPTTACDRLQPPTTACNRLRPPTTACTAYDRLQPPAPPTAYNRLQPPAPPAPPLQQNRLFLPTHLVKGKTEKFSRLVIDP